MVLSYSDLCVLRERYTSIAHDYQYLPLILGTLVRFCWTSERNGE